MADEFLEELFSDLGAEVLIKAIAEVENDGLPDDFRERVAATAVDAMVVLRTYDGIIRDMAEEFGADINLALLAKNTTHMLEELTAMGVSMDPMQMAISINGAFNHQQEFHEDHDH